jgi:succinate dehydrogenase / fumarate reductase cytochrome b subunit
MQLTDRRYATLKRLQILTGVLPVGAFLLSHLWTNAHAIAGPAAFAREVEWIGRIPYLGAVEVLAILVPLFVHVALGIALGSTAQGAEDAAGYPSRWMLRAQRATGFFLVVYIVFHVWSTRLSPARLGGHDALFDIMARNLALPGVFAFHVAGVLSAAFHFGNGLVALAGPWGLGWGDGARRAMGWAGLIAFVLLSIVGVNALLAFAHPAARWLTPAGSTP